MARVPITVWDLLARTGHLARAHAGRVLLSFALITGLSTAGRLVVPGGVEFGLVTWAAWLLCQYDLTAALLIGLGLMPAGGWLRRLWPMVGLCLLSEFGIMFGFGLFVIPGLVLAVRWLLSGPILLAEETDIIAALGRSWQETSANFWLLLQLLALLWSPFLVYVGIGLLPGSPLAESRILNTIGNALAYAGAVASWVAAVAAYAASRRAPAHLGRVFT